MTFLSLCGSCCMIISVWGVIQLNLTGKSFDNHLFDRMSAYKDGNTPKSGKERIFQVLMGIFYKVEAVVMIDDVVPEEYTDYADFIKKTKENYAIVALNCWIAAALYLLMIGISYMCIAKARSIAAKETKRLEDDELSCKPKQK